MRKIWKTVTGSLAVFLVVALIFAGGFFTGRYYGNKAEIMEETPAEDFDLKLPGEIEKRVITADEVRMKLVEIGELSTYSGEYSVSKSADFTRYFLDDIAIPGTTNSIKIECQGIVKVGYDIEEIVPQIDNVSQKIYIALPEARVLDNYVIWDTVKCSENNTIFNPIDFAQYQTLISEIESQGLNQAEADGIYVQAEDHIKLIIQNFLSGFEEFEIIFL